MSELRANIHPKAKLGKDVVVEPFSTVYDDVEIGDGTWIGPNVTIMDGARIGKNCKIFPGAVISAIPQDLKYAGEETLTIIGDNTTIRECVTINKGTVDAYKTEVGSNCLLMAYVHVAHDCKVGNNVILANCVNLAGHIAIEDFAILEGMVAVQQFVRIGSHSFIAGGSLVRKNVPPYVRAAREPLSYVGINAIGLKRRGYSEEDVNAIEQIYRLIFVHNRITSKGLIAVREQAPESKFKTEILEFFDSSTNGVMRGST
ncbi:MAG: acyl-ACP--UDP-N-acetylglucosamine O-acyltransferase [Salibacteraceae bacterium]